MISGFKEFELLEDECELVKSELRVTCSLQEHVPAGGPSFSTDHCPLLFELAPQDALTRDVVPRSH